MNFSDQFLKSLAASQEANLSTIKHVSALVFLSLRENGAYLSDIGRGIKASQAAMTGIADKLEEMGLAKRKADDLDRRISRLCITAKGRDAVDMILNPKPKQNV